jgi:hypothetical protein
MTLTHPAAHEDHGDEDVGDDAAAVCCPCGFCASHRRRRMRTRRKRKK